MVSKAEALTIFSDFLLKDRFISILVHLINSKFPWYIN